MKTKFFFVILVAFATISIFSSCTDSTGGYQRPDLSSVASGLHNAGTDTTIVSGHCNIDYVPVVGTNCSGKTVIRQKPTIARYAVPTVFKTEGSSLSSDDLVNRIKSIGYRIVPDRGHGYSDAIKNPVKSENSFFDSFSNRFSDNLLNLLYGLFGILILFLLLLLLLSMIRWLLDILRNRYQAPPTQPINNWQSENIQPLCNELHSIINNAVNKGNDVQLNTTSTATSTTVDLHITRKDPTPDLKQEG